MILERTKTQSKLVEAAWKKHAIRNALVAVGKHRDNLLHALVPLYFTRAETVKVTSGDASRWWTAHGVRVSPQVCAKALREHIGYARRMRTGVEITPNGVKYVEAALDAR